NGGQQGQHQHQGRGEAALACVEHHLLLSLVAGARGGGPHGGVLLLVRVLRPVQQVRYLVAERLERVQHLPHLLHPRPLDAAMGAPLGLRIDAEDLVVLPGTDAPLPDAPAPTQ
ncbi:MAG: hypothetical protein ACO3VG_06215, partial [Nitriliruptoraceae bacterium]